MDKSLFSFCTKQLMLAAVGGFVGGMVMASGSAVAQPAEEITVVAPHTVTEAGRSAVGVKLEVVSLTHRVSYTGLDLAKHSDVAELERRINAAAKEACQQLDTLYPPDAYPSNPSNQNCVKTAVDDGMMQAKMVVAAAHK